MSMNSELVTLIMFRFVLKYGDFKGSHVSAPMARVFPLF